ncbi:MAG: rod shape-determining protein MreD [Nitrospiraceae bacterium]
MKQVLYLTLVFGLVPIQTTVLAHASVGGIRPDLCLVAASLVGLFTGELEGLLLGLAMGFVQDLFSAGELWLNLVTKGSVGFLAGVAGRYVANATTITALAAILGLSFLSGTVFLFTVGPGGLRDASFAVRAVLLPQAMWDAALGAGLYWLLAKRFRREQAILEGSSGLGSLMR